MSFLVVIIIIAGAVALGLLLAYLPMRILLTRMAKSVTAPIQAFIQRQRDRRAASRQSPDRRKSA